MPVALDEHSVRVELRGQYRERRNLNARQSWSREDAIRFAQERYARAVVEWDVFVMAFYNDYLHGLGA